MAINKLVIYTDGASRGNPGPAAIGVVLRDSQGNLIESVSRRLGVTTNNQAEYHAIIAGLERALELGATHVELHSDSELVVRQLSSRYKVKNEALKPLYQKIEELRARLDGLAISYILREKNKEADKLASQALEGAKQARRGESPAISVRRATRADYPPVLSIFAELEKQHVEAMPEFFKRMTHEEQVQELDSIMADEKAVLMVAERNGQVLGCIHLGLKESESYPVLRPRRYIKIHDIAVGSGFQGSGAGSALMHAAEQWAEEHGIHTIELNVWDFNRGAFAFYQKVGYVIASRHMWKHI